MRRWDLWFPVWSPQRKLPVFRETCETAIVMTHRHQGSADGKGCVLIQGPADEITELTLETRTFFPDKEIPGQGERFLKSVSFSRTESDVILSGDPWPMRLWTVMLSTRDFLKLKWFLNLTLNLAHFHNLLSCVGCVWTKVRRCFSGR